MVAETAIVKANAASRSRTSSFTCAVCTSPSADASAFSRGLPKGSLYRGRPQTQTRAMTQRAIDTNCGSRILFGSDLRSPD